MSGTRGSQTEGTSKYGDKILRKVPSKQLFDSADFSLQGKEYLNQQLPSVIEAIRQNDEAIKNEDSNNNNDQSNDISTSSKPPLSPASPKMSPNATNRKLERVPSGDEAGRSKSPPSTDIRKRVLRKSMSIEKVGDTTELAQFKAIQLERNNNNSPEKDKITTTSNMEGESKKDKNTENKNNQDKSVSSSKPEEKENKKEQKEEKSKEKSTTTTATTKKSQQSDSGISVATTWTLIAILILLVLASFPTYKFVRQFTTFNNLKPTGTVVNHLNSQFHFYCSGEGSPTILMEAPIGYGHYFYGSVQSLISQFTRVCTYDAPGVGFTGEFSQLQFKEIVKIIGVKSPLILVGNVRTLEYCQEFSTTGDVVSCILINPLIRAESPRLDRFAEHLDIRSTLSMMGLEPIFSAFSDSTEKPHLALSDSDMLLLQRDRNSPKFWTGVANELRASRKIHDSSSISGVRRTPFHNVSAVILTIPESPMAPFNNLVLYNNEKILQERSSLFEPNTIVLVEEPLFASLNQIVDEVRRAFGAARGENKQNWARDAESDSKLPEHYGAFNFGGSSHGHDHGHSHGHDDHGHDHSHGHFH